MSNAIVKNSLLRSSINIKSISRSVSSFSTGFIKAQAIATDIQKQTEDDKEYKSTLIRSDDSYFRKRQENIKRKDREDEIEASTVGGAIRRTGSVASKSTRGFLGRILDFMGVMFVGWILTTLPSLNKSILGFIKRASVLVGALSGLVDNTVDSLFRLGGDLANSDEAIKQIDLSEDERFMREELDSTENAFRKLTIDVFRTMETFNDPRTMGIPMNSWDEVGSMPLEGEGQSQEQEQEPESPTDKANNLGVLTPGGTTKKEETKKEETKKEEDTKEESKEEPKGDTVEGTNTTPKELTPKGKTDNDTTSKEEDSNEEFKLEPGEDSGFDMYKDGGIVEGKSHQEGGENINVEGGEAIVPKKSVEKYTPEFINRIIKGDADKVTKLRASRSLLEKLVEQHKEENMGVIRVDEFDKLQEETVGKLKKHLAQSQGLVEGIKEQIESTDLGGLDSEEAIEVQKNLISSIIEPIKKSKVIGKKRRKTPKIIPVPAVSSRSSSASPPSSPSINRGGSPSQVSVKSDEGIWNKLQTLELHYT